MSGSRVSAWLPVVTWAAVIFALSSVPHLGTGLGTWDTILRKGAHVTEYAILGLLLMRAVGRETPAFLLGVAYAITDELHQHFVRGRHSSPIDVAIDSAGVLIGVLVLARAHRWVRWQRRIEPMPERKSLDDRQLDAVLERLDKLVDEIHVLNRRLDHAEGFARVAHELRTLNESLQAIAYAALGQQGPQVRRRRAG